MRAAASLTTIHQTLTPEAASVLSQSIADASRRFHGHTTPLHVAAALLASPSGFLRQACIVSHPHSLHPLQCRALDLCFSVALERLPTVASPEAPPPPPLSNALTTALKRAQAHQRRGCPEQQQQPLLAVKVDLDQLVVSILDDPSVSRVMREAQFSSPAVKAAVEQSRQVTSSSGWNPYLNPRLHNRIPSSVKSGNQRIRDEYVNRVIEVLSKSKNRNPIIVGESEPVPVLKEVLRRIKARELGDAGSWFTNVEIVSVEKELGSANLKELGGFVLRRRRTMLSGVLIVDLGDFKWLVDNRDASDDAREAVAEMGKIIARFGGRVRVIGTATCETYLRCQVYHPTMEDQWDLQVVSVVAEAPLPATLHRIGTNGIVGNPSESFTPLKSTLPATLQSSACCSQCMHNYEQEVSELSAQQSDRSVSGDGLQETQKQLPQWLQNATVCDNGVQSASDSSQIKDHDPLLNRKTEELMKIWSDRCFLLHPSFHQNSCNLAKSNPTPLSLTRLYANPKLLARQQVQPNTHQTKTLGDDLRLNIDTLRAQPVDRLQTSPNSLVRTDLVLGQTKMTQNDRVKDLLGFISSDPPSKVNEMQCHDKPLDADSFKKLLKGLIGKVWWQGDAASSVATTITQCKLGNGGRRAGGAKGDIWLLFSGPDRTGKKKMAAALSELVCGTALVIISLGLRRDGEESGMNFRGKTVLDRIAEGIRRNPFSVIMLQDIDEADMLARGSIKRAMERGRFTDSNGKEISLGNIIFVLTVNKQPLSSCGQDQLDEDKLLLMASGAWQLKLLVDNQKVGKRHPDGLVDEDERVSKQRRETGGGRLSFDLNEIADTEEDRFERSHNSSDLTVEHDQDNMYSPATNTSTSGDQLLDSVDECIAFKPVDFSLIRQNIERTITRRFRMVFGEKMLVRIESEAVDRILGGAWMGSNNGLDSWTEKVLAPTIHQLKSRLFDLPIASLQGGLVARLELELDEKYSLEDRSNGGNWLPSRIKVWVLGEEMGS